MNGNSVMTTKGITDEFFSCPEDKVDSLNKVLMKFQSILSGADRIKRDVFLNISERGLNRLLFLLKHSSEDVRKNSFKVLALLFHNNEILQNIFCEKYSFNPIGNVIVINWLPQELKNAVKINEHVLYEIKKTQNNDLGNKDKLYWQWPENNKYNNDNLPDPQKYLLGIYCANRAQINMEEKTFEDTFDVGEVISKLEK